MGLPKKMRAAPRRMSLKAWIEKTGVSEVARLLQVRRETVRYWRIGHCYPRVEQMREIKALTKGIVGYEQIIDGPGRDGGGK